MTGQLKTNKKERRKNESEEEEKEREKKSEEGVQEVMLEALKFGSNARGRGGEVKEVAIGAGGAGEVVVHKKLGLWRRPRACACDAPRVFHPHHSCCCCR
jgi:hypothetical protein